MRYFVIGSNGELYGPADVETLNKWILEGRLSPTTEIQEELGGVRFAASLLEGLSFGSSYPRGMVPPQQIIDNGATEMKNAWIYGLIGLFCFGIVLGPVGLVYAIKAKQKGHPQAVGGIILCSITTLGAMVWLGLVVSGYNPLSGLIK